MSNRQESKKKVWVRKPKVGGTGQSEGGCLKTRKVKKPEWQ